MVDRLSLSARRCTRTTINDQRSTRYTSARHLGQSMSSTPSIGKYRLLERIGQGAMGEVFRAHDPVLDRQVALKIISGADDDRRQRFHREAQSAARLAHPNIVVVHDFGEDSGRFYMAMELLEGRDLKAIIAMNAISE